MPVCPHGTTLPSEHILSELDIWVFVENLSRKLKFNLKSDKKNGHFTWRPMYSYGDISPNS